MFKEATIYRITGPLDHADLTRALAGSAFAPTSATQQRATGWEPPRAAHGAMLENIGGHWLASYCIETRAVPADAVQAKADEMAAAIERETGRQPGKRERREIKDDALHALLPQAFPRQVSVPVWIDPNAGLLVIGTCSTGKLYAITTSLVRACHTGTQITHIQTRTSPGAAMAGWLLDPATLPACLSIGRECELRGSGAEEPVMRLNRCDLDSEDVRARVAAGMLPTRIALDWQGACAFVLTHTLQLRKLEIAAVETSPEEDAFDANFALTTGTLAPCIADLIDALGGEEPAQPD